MQIKLKITIAILGLTWNGMRFGVDDRQPPLSQQVNVQTVAIQAAATAAAEELIAVMTDRSATWEARCAAEDALTQLPSREVLHVVLPHIEKGWPTSVFWNSGGDREVDKLAPVNWQIYYAVQRTWVQQVQALPGDSAGTVLLELLEQTEETEAQRLILGGLTNRLIPEAEVQVAAILKSPEKALVVRAAAALALILHGTDDYHRLLLEYTQTGCFADRTQWFDLLSNPSHKTRTGIDPQVVQIGFGLLVEERESSSEDIHGAYFLAIKTGNYVGQTFQPDRTRSRYQGENRLPDCFFADTATNAIEWWKSNQTRFEQSTAAPATP